MKKATQQIQLPVSTVSPANVSQAYDFMSAHPAGALWFQFTGTFVASYKPEVSIDGGNTWVDATKLFKDVAGQTVLAADISTDATVMVSGTVPLLRFRCTAFTSATGTPVVDVIYHDSRSV